jgi:hypothetical protein
MLFNVPLAVFAGKFEYWFKQSVEPELGAGFSIKLQSEEKFDQHRLYDTEQYFVLYYSFCDYLKLGPGYRFVRERGGNGHFSTEHRPMFDILLSTPSWMNLKIDSRTRIEIRDKAASQVYMRYRQRFTLGIDEGYTDFDLKPYVMFEMFFDDAPKRNDYDVMNRTRSRIGTSFVPILSARWLKMDFYYQIQHDKDDDVWAPTNVFGLDLKFDF